MLRKWSIQKLSQISIVCFSLQDVQLYLPLAPNLHLQGCLVRFLPGSIRQNYTVGKNPVGRRFCRPGFSGYIEMLVPENLNKQSSENMDAFGIAKSALESGLPGSKNRHPLNHGQNVKLGFGGIVI
jgi:hypothetical protein